MVKISLVISTILCLFSNTWVSLWILLEINTLAFCSLLFLKFPSEMKKNKEMTMKYLIIQSIASALLIITAMSLKLTYKTSFLIMTLLTLSLMIKMASVPTHQWFVNMTKKMSWTNNMILLTWQKLAPVFLTIYQAKILLYPFLLASGMVGAIALINKVLMKEIMAFSSIFNLSWMLLAISMSLKILILFSLIYWISLIFILKLFDSTSSSTISEVINQKKSKFVSLMMLMSMAGIPPLMGFMAKWMVFSMASNLNLNPLVTMLLIITSINLFVYLRMVNPVSMKFSSNIQKSLNLKWSTSSILFIYLNIMMMPMLII
nr:NADH dehydrogenase subunit 2 [Oribatula sakamorii]